MDPTLIIYASVVVLVAVVVRIPFMHFPMDEDFATWTYRARFSSQGLKWKQDMFCFYPTWRMHLIDALYREPKKGMLRIRIFLSLMHILGSTTILLFAESLTREPTAAFLTSLLYAFFASAPVYSTESFNFEQVYVPFVIGGFYLFSLGPNYFFASGLCFGLAVLPKVSTGIFLPGMMALTGWQYGFSEVLVFTNAAILPVIVSHIIEWKMGYLDIESINQFHLRLATTLRCSRLKRMYGSIRRDISLILTQTLPLWILGPFGLIFFLDQPRGPMLMLYTITTFIMILCQRGFSRYHYFPMMAVWAITSVAVFDWMLKIGFNSFVFFLIFAMIGWTIYQILPFYIKPMGTIKLARYEKFDQWLYIPYLGKLLKRYFNIKGDIKGRLFVWGNYVQLYHLTGKPAADQYVHYAIGPWDDPILTSFFDTIIGGLLKYRPSIFIKVFHDFDMDLLKKVTGLDYRLIKVVLGRFPVYKLQTFQKTPYDPLALRNAEKLKLLTILTNGDHSPGISRLDETRGRFHKALAELRKLVKLNPWDNQGLFALAELYERMGKTKDAIKTFKILITLMPKHPNYRTRLAKLMIDQGKLNEADAILKTESNQFGNTSGVRFHRGLLARIQGRHLDAIGYFKSVLKECPDWHDCRLNLAELAQENGNIKESQKFYAELWDRTPKLDWMRTQAALGLATCNIHLCSKSKTLVIFHLRDPNNEPLAYALASVLEHEGNHEEARLRFSQYTQKFQKYHLRASAWFRLGRLSNQIKNRKSYLLHCLKLNPSHEGARRLLEEVDVCKIKT